MGQWQLAIDFGTTNTAAAVLRDDVVVPLRLSSAADQMPSGVLARPDGSLLVGEVAANEAAMYLDGYEPNPKYRLGEEAVYLGGRDWSPVELVAEVLRRVGDKARAVGAVPAGDGVVLTHPVAWHRHKRDRLRDAALLAGFADVRMVSEPIAAARWYAAGHGPDRAAGSVLRPDATLAVFDFGGGTCDVAILRAADEHAEDFDVLASGGDPYLGGEELDRVLVDWAVERALEGADPAATDRVEHARGGPQWFTLRDAVRRAKHTLSEADTATIPFALGETSRSLPITRQEFDDLVAPHMDRAIELTRRVFDVADTTPDRLAELPGGTAALFLTGGSATIPVVRERMHALLDRSAARLDDPKTVVPRGALVAPGVVAADVRETVASPVPPAPSLVLREVEQRRDAERRARPAEDPALPRRVAELEEELAGLRRELRERADPSEPRTATRPSTPTSGGGATSPTLAPDRPATPAPEPGPARQPAPARRSSTARRSSSGWRVLFGLLLGAVGLGSLGIGALGIYYSVVDEFTEDLPLALAFVVAGLVLVGVARRLLRRRRR